MVLLKRGSSQNAMRCVDLGCEALNDIIDLSVIGSYNSKQAGFQHDVELDHGRPSCGRRNKLLDV